MNTHLRPRAGLLNSLLSLLLTACIGNVAATGQLPMNPEVQAFEKRYLEIQGSVALGQLSAEVGSRAKQLRFTLNKALIELDARKAMLKLEASEFEGERQSAALDELMELGAERQRAIARAHHQLEALAGTAGPLPPVTPLVSSPPAERDPLSPENAPTKLGTEQVREMRRLIGIELEPEDVTKGDFE